VEGPGSPEAVAVVAVAVALPPGIAESLQSIDTAVTSFEQFRYKRRDLVRLYVTLIGLIFIATLFVATWIGWYVARRITEPIQEVAAAAREISAGNMDVRVHTRVGDEMGMLVDAFNEMAGELQENREVITRSTAELRRSNQALDERRRYIETLVANLSTAVISLDPSGGVTTANPAVEEILGVRLNAGDNAATVLRDKGLKPLGELLGQVQRSEDESVRRDVELPETAPAQHVSVQVSPLKGRSDEDLGSLMMVEDLSDVLRAQKALAWQDVARRIAHEIKNPLTPIQLAAQRLRKKFFAGADDLNQVLLEATASIEREVSGLKRMVDEFSRFARMPRVEPEPVEFGKVVESVLSLYKGLPGIEWQVDLDPQIGWVSLDAQQMRRALINLIDNAVAAMEEQGTIRISARTVGGNGSVRIEVADSGPGIAPADRDKMFAPYFSTKRRGTGLGLAIVHKVVTDHRGTIRVEDNPPSGVRFVIEIPG
jgi:two-component system nitrogen regulation sensor histidine kinase NtrY